MQKKPHTHTHIYTYTHTHPISDFKFDCFPVVVAVAGAAPVPKISFGLFVNLVVSQMLTMYRKTNISFCQSKVLFRSFFPRFQNYTGSESGTSEISKSFPWSEYKHTLFHFILFNPFGVFIFIFIDVQSKL